MQQLGTIKLETNRLILRRVTMDDAQMAFDNWCSYDEVTKYLTWPTHKSVEDTKAFFKFNVENYQNDDFYQWGIVLKEDQQLIGTVSVVEYYHRAMCFELGWCLSQKYWGRGIMSEAVLMVMDFLFNEVGANRIWARCDHRNQKSARVMEKVGMHYEGLQKEISYNNQGICDLDNYYILRSEYVEK